MLLFPNVLAFDVKGRNRFFAILAGAPLVAHRGTESPDLRVVFGFVLLVAAKAGQFLHPIAVFRALAFEREALGIEAPVRVIRIRWLWRWGGGWFVAVLVAGFATKLLHFHSGILVDFVATALFSFSAGPFAIASFLTVQSEIRGIGASSGHLDGWVPFTVETIVG